MRLKPVRFKGYIRLKNNKLLLQAFLLRAHEMFLVEVHDQRIIIKIILLVLGVIPSVTYETTFVCFPAMAIQLITAVKPFTAKSTLRMPFEATLITRPRHIIPFSFMLLELWKCK